MGTVSGVLVISADSNSNPIRHLEEHAKAIAAQLNRLGVRYAVVGGIAVSFRAVVRTTNDLDLAVFVNDDAEAETIVNTLIGLGYRAEVILESEVSGRLATVRMISAGEREVFVDLLFASTGIEGEVVEGADTIEIFPNLALRVASRPALIALKTLSANPKTRLKDITDLQNLLTASSTEELGESRRLLHLITERGFDRNKDLLGDLEGYLNQFDLST